MPYFRRGEGVEARSLAAAGGVAVASAHGIVERATAILESQPLSEPGRGTQPPLPLPTTAQRGVELGDLEQRVSELLAGFLQLLAPAGSGSPPAVPAPLTDALTIGALSGAAAPKFAGPSSVPVVEVAAPAQAGSLASVALSLVNEVGEAVSAVPYCSDLISNSGHQISALHVAFVPRTVPLASGALGSTELRIRVPEQAGPGKYSMLVQAMGLERPCAVVVLTVS